MVESEAVATEYFLEPLGSIDEMFLAEFCKERLG